MAETTGLATYRVHFTVTKQDYTVWADFDFEGTSVQLYERFNDWRNQPGCRAIIVKLDDRIVLEYNADAGYLARVTDALPGDRTTGL